MPATDRDPMLLERLNRHPFLRARVESLLEVVEDAAGDCGKADAAERRVIEELRQMGNEMLTAWAERGVETHAGVAQAEPDWRPGGKKTLLVHDLRSDRGRRTALAERRGHRAAFQCPGGGQLPGQLAAVATGDDRFWRG
jgi:hypothetical protein